MKTLDVEEAASFCKCSNDTMYQLIKTGEVRATKFGKKYVLIDVDLIDDIRAKYPTVNKAKSCQSISAAQSGGHTSLSTVKRLDNLLEPKIESKRNKNTTSLKLV